MRKLMIIQLLALLMMPVCSWAQENEPEKISGGESETHYIRRPFQISFVSPLGTNGLEGKNVVNNLSFNMIGGYAAGLHGLEFGGVYNIERAYVKGMQFAGIANIVGEEVDGIQFAGFTNISSGTVDGAQFSGFANINRGYTKGVQFAGFANIIADRADALQFAGFCNVVKGDVKGVQVAGFTNITGGDVDGLQISGFFNRARNLKGMQIGVINVCESVEDGVAIGLLSFVKNGLRQVEISGNEALNTVVAYKTGTEQFYNILAIGAQYMGDTFRWGVGYGVGTQFNMSPNVAANIEATAFQINEDEWWTDKLNLLNQLKFTVAPKISDNFSIFFGPTFNVMVSEINNDGDRVLGSGIAPWTVYNEKKGNVNVKMWPGFSIGVRL